MKWKSRRQSSHIEDRRGKDPLVDLVVKPSWVVALGLC